MKAMVIDECGDVFKFKQQEVKIPSFSSLEMLIKVKATSVNPIDCKIRQGAVPHIVPSFPATLHGDVAGTVEEVGRDVPHHFGFKKGDSVYGFAGGVKGYSGALAEYMSVKASLMAPMPSNLTFEEAAALPLVSLTAQKALSSLKAPLGSPLLIHGLLGGVGHIACQLAKSCGFFVSGTISKEEKRVFAQKLAPEKIFISSHENFHEDLMEYTKQQGFPFILDTVGGGLLTSSLQSMALSGTIVTIAARSLQDLTPLHNKAGTLKVISSLHPLTTGKGEEDVQKQLTTLSHFVEQSLVTPLIWTTLPITEVSTAHKLLESREVGFGKIVLKNEW